MVYRLTYLHRPFTALDAFCSLWSKNQLSFAKEHCHGCGGMCAHHHHCPRGPPSCLPGGGSLPPMPTGTPEHHSCMALTTAKPAFHSATRAPSKSQDQQQLQVHRTPGPQVLWTLQMQPFLSREFSELSGSSFGSEVKEINMSYVFKSSDGQEKKPLLPDSSSTASPGAPQSVRTKGARKPPKLHPGMWRPAESRATAALAIPHCSGRQPPQSPSKSTSVAQLPAASPFPCGCLWLSHAATSPVSQGSAGTAPAGRRRYSIPVSLEEDNIHKSTLVIWMGGAWSAHSDLSGHRPLLNRCPSGSTASPRGRHASAPLHHEDTEAVSLALGGSWGSMLIKLAPDLRCCGSGRTTWIVSPAHPQPAVAPDSLLGAQSPMCSDPEDLPRVHRHPPSLQPP